MPASTGGKDIRCAAKSIFKEIGASDNDRGFK